MELDRCARRYSVRPSALLGIDASDPLALPIDLACAVEGDALTAQAITRSGGVFPVVVMGAV